MSRNRKIWSSISHDESDKDVKFVRSLFDEHKLALSCIGVVFKPFKSGQECCYFSTNQEFTDYYISNDIVIAKIFTGDAYNFLIKTNSLIKHKSEAELRKFPDGEDKDKYLFDSIKEATIKSLKYFYSSRFKTDNPNYQRVKEIYESIEQDGDGKIKTVDNGFKIIINADNSFVILKYNAGKYLPLNPKYVELAAGYYGELADKFYLDSAEAAVGVHNISYSQKLCKSVTDDIEKMRVRKDRYNDSFVISNSSDDGWFQFSKGNTSYIIHPKVDNVQFFSAGMAGWEVLNEKQSIKILKELNAWRKDVDFNIDCEDLEASAVAHSDGVNGGASAFAGSAHVLDAGVSSTSPEGDALKDKVAPSKHTANASNEVVADHHFAGRKFYDSTEARSETYVRRNEYEILEGVPGKMSVVAESQAPNYAAFKPSLGDEPHASLMSRRLGSPEGAYKEPLLAKFGGDGAGLATSKEYYDGGSGGRGEDYKMARILEVFGQIADGENHVIKHAESKKDPEIIFNDNEYAIHFFKGDLNLIINKSEGSIICNDGDLFEEIYALANEASRVPDEAPTSRSAKEPTTNFTTLYDALISRFGNAKEDHSDFGNQKKDLFVIGDGARGRKYPYFRHDGGLYSIDEDDKVYFIITEEEVDGDVNSEPILIEDDTSEIIKEVMKKNSIDKDGAEFFLLSPDLATASPSAKGIRSSGLGRNL